MTILGTIPLGMDREQIGSVLDSAAPHVSEEKPEEKKRYVERRYNELSSVRSPYLDEARLICQAIMPYLYPPDSQASDTFSLPAANQSLVGKGVINICTELSSTVFPANARFFRNTVMPELAQSIEIAKLQLGQEDAFNVATEQSAINNKLVARDQTLREIIKATPDAENFYMALLHCVVAGTACFAKPNLDTSKVYPLDQFVAEFDSTGELVDVVVKDEIHVSKFSPDQLRELFGHDDIEVFEQAKMTSIPVFTRQVRRFDHWEIQVEIAGQRYKKMEGKEDLESPPLIVFPFFMFPGHKLGVSYCSHNKGDIIQFENMSLAINEMAKAACKILAVLPPELKATQNEISNNPGLSFIFANQANVQMILADISKNMQAIQGVYDLVRQALMGAYLMKEAIRRNAERVTQEEIKEMAAGLRQLLGGLYISISRRFQHPYINRVERLAVNAGKIPRLPEGTAQITLTAGLETLESEEDQAALDGLVAKILGINPEWLKKINGDEYITRTGNNLSVPLDGLVMSEEEQARQAGVDQLIELANQLGPQGPQIVAGVATQLVTQFMGKGGAGDLMGMMQQQQPETQETEGPSGPAAGAQLQQQM